MEKPPSIQSQQALAPGGENIDILIKCNEEKVQVCQETIDRVNDIFAIYNETVRTPSYEMVHKFLDALTKQLEDFKEELRKLKQIKEDHEKYKPGGAGYEETRDHFNSLQN